MTKYLSSFFLGLIFLFSLNLNSLDKKKGSGKLKLKNMLYDSKDEYTPNEPGNVELEDDHIFELVKEGKRKYFLFSIRNGDFSKDGYDFQCPLCAFNFNIEKERDEIDKFPRTRKALCHFVNKHEAECEYIGPNELNLYKIYLPK